MDFVSNGRGPRVFVGSGAWAWRLRGGLRLGEWAA
jgi:hypothetical protein